MGCDEVGAEGSTKDEADEPDDNHTVDTDDDSEVSVDNSAASVDNSSKFTLPKFAILSPVSLTFDRYTSSERPTYANDVGSNIYQKAQVN